MIYLQVEPVPHDVEADGACLLDPHVMAHEGLEADDVVAVESPSGRRVVVRLGEPLEADHDTDSVRLGEQLRKPLKVAVGDTVAVEAAVVDSLASLTVAPLSDVRGIERADLAGYVARSLRNRGELVNEEAIVYLTLPGAEGAAGFKVVSATPAQGIVDGDTDVSVEYVFPTWGRPEETTFEDIGGLAPELQHVRELVEFPIRFPDVFRRLGIRPPKGVILFGPPGTGKTLMVKAIANELDATFEYINGPGIVDPGYGRTEERLREIFTEARQSLPSIVFIDELDAIAPQRGETGAHADLRVVTQLLELMDGLESTEGVGVIGTTNRLEAIEGALRRPGRFDREIYIGPPDEAARREILGIHTRGMVLSEAVGSYLDELAGRTQGYTGADVMELSREAGINALRRRVGPDWSAVRREDVKLADLVVEPADFEAALDTVQPTVLRGSLAATARADWDDLGGLDDAKARLRTLIERPVRQPGAFASMGIDRSPGVLLVGPSGSGKTALARGAAAEFGFTLLELDATDVYSQWLGKSEEAVRHAFRVARRSAPTVLLVDNLESLGATRRSGDDGGIGTRVTNQLLTEMDRIAGDVRVAVVGTTSREDLVDPALLAADRFGERIELGLPDATARRAILDVHLAGAETALDEADLAAVVQATEGFTGGELAALCRDAKLVALEADGFGDAPPVVADHLEAALEVRR